MSSFHNIICESSLVGKTEEASTTYRISHTVVLYSFGLVLSRVSKVRVSVSARVSFRVRVSVGANFFGFYRVAFLLFHAIVACGVTVERSLVTQKVTGSNLGRSASK